MPETRAAGARVFRIATARRVTLVSGGLAMIGLVVGLLCVWPPRPEPGAWLGVILVGGLVALPGAFLVGVGLLAARARLVLDDEGVALTSLRGQTRRLSWAEIASAEVRQTNSATGARRPGALVVHPKRGVALAIPMLWGEAAAALRDALSEHGIAVRDLP